MNLAQKRIRKNKDGDLPPGAALIARTFVLLLATMLLFWTLSDPKTGVIRSPILAGLAFLAVVAAVLVMAIIDSRRKNRQDPRDH